MSDYFEYFNQLDKFVAKKNILADLQNDYGVTLSTSAYNKLIKDHVKNGVIAKSTDSPGRCSYISQSFLEDNDLEAISYYRSLKTKGQGETEFHKSVSFTEDTVKHDAIKEVPLSEVFDEL